MKLKKTKRLYTTWRVLFFIFFLFLTFTNKMYAQHADYNIQTLLPENQVDKNINDFDLIMHPNDVQTIYLYINNTSEQANTFAISVNQAYTNTKGIIDYSDKTEPDESILYSISEIATYEPSITVEAHSSVKYSIELSMPEKEFSGQIMAGIHIKNETIKQGNNDSIIKLSITENNKEIERALNMTDSYPTVIGSHTKIILQLENPTMEPYQQLTYVTRLTDTKSNKIIFTETHDDGQQLAPNSSYDLVMNWDTSHVKEGEYMLGLIVNDEKGNQWIWEEPLNIHSSKADQLNTVIKKNRKKNGWLLFLGLFLLPLFISGSFVVIRKKKKKKRKLRKKTKRNRNQKARKKVTPKRNRYVPK